MFKLKRYVTGIKEKMPQQRPFTILEEEEEEDEESSDIIIIRKVLVFFFYHLSFSVNVIL
jgi:hypothetical protein